MTVEWSTLTVGLVMMSAGMVIFIYQRQATKVIRDAQRSMYGKLGDRQGANKWGILVAALGTAVLGLVIAVLSVVLPPIATSGEALSVFSGVMFA